MFLRRCFVWQILAVVAVAGWESAARGDDPLQKGFVHAAKNIQAVMKDIHAESVTILEFEDKTTLGATVGAGMKQILTEELNRLKVAMKPRGGAIGVKGVIKVANTEIGGKVLKIDFVLTDINGDDLKSVNVTIPNPDEGSFEKTIKVAAGKIPQQFPNDSAILTAFGGNVDLHTQPPISGDDQNFDALQESIDHPTALIVDQVTAKASKTSPFGLQVVSEGKAKPLKMVEGQPFVELNPGEKFTLQVVNNAPFKAHVTATLDGLNSYRFSKIRKTDGSPKYSAYVLPAGLSSIKGWHLDNSTVQEFVATSYEESKLKELGLAATPIGAITVEFRAAMEQGKSQPPDENNVRKLVQGPNGTKRFEIIKQYGAVFIGGGNEVEANVKEVSVQPGRLRGVVSIRYRHPTVK